jgi:hypothetical protein
LFYLGFVQTVPVLSSLTNFKFLQDNQNSLIVSGALSFPDGSSGNVAIFSLGNNTWEKLGKDGDLPGPVTAAEVNDGNSSSIFVTGKSTDGTQSYLSFWNGLNWTQLREFLTPCIYWRSRLTLFPRVGFQ